MFPVHMGEKLVQFASIPISVSRAETDPTQLLILETLGI